METNPAFNLNQAIQQWRESLNQSAVFRTENLDELGAHLRDSIEKLEQNGLTTEEAFFIARRRLGATPLLTEEFGKVNSRNIWLNRVLWMLIGVQALALVQSVSTIVTVATTTAFVQFGKSVQTSSWMPWLLGFQSACVRLLTFGFAFMLVWRFLVGKSKWKSAGCNAASQRPALMVGLCLTALVLTRVVSGGSTALMARTLNWEVFERFLPAISYGSIAANSAETLGMIVVTLLLARREILAKTTA